MLTAWLADRTKTSEWSASCHGTHPPEVSCPTLFSSLDRDITLAFVKEYPAPDQAARVRPTRMAALCRRRGHSGQVETAVLVERMRPHLPAASAGTAAGEAPAAPDRHGRLEEGSVVLH
jgi:hypothetical protein